MKHNKRRDHEIGDWCRKEHAKAIAKAGGDVATCPLCDREPFWIGSTSADGAGIECRCGLKLSQAFPARWPKEIKDAWVGVPLGTPFNEDPNHRRLVAWVLVRVIKQWNTRPKTTKVKGQ